MASKTDEHAGFCRYCGQQRMIIEDGLSQEERDERATLNCTCKDGREYRAEVEDKKRIKQMIEDSKSITCEQLSKDFPDIENFCNMIIPKMVALEIPQIVLKFEKTKISIRYTGNEISIARTDISKKEDKATK